MKLRNLCYAASIAVAVCLVQAASALTTNYWSGAGDGSTWSSPANWVNGAVPSPNSNVVYRVFLGTGYPTATPTPIVLSSTDSVHAIDQVFGPEWGETFDVYGHVSGGFGLAPIGAFGPGLKSTVNLYGNATYDAGDTLFIGDMFWFAGGPNIDLNCYNNSSITAPFIAVGGHLNLYDNSTATTLATNRGGLIGGLLIGPPGAGFWGGASSDQTRWINLAGGKLILNDMAAGNSNTVMGLIGRGIFLCYGKQYDTNEFTITDDGTNTIISVTNSLGTLNSLGVQSVNGITNMMVGFSSSVLAVGNFANMSDVPLSRIDAAQSGGGTVGYQSTATNVATVTSAGVVTAVSPGTAQISATYANSSFGSFTSLYDVSIIVTPYTNNLVHRYSFSETGGTTTADSVGGAAWDGTVSGGTLGGGKVTLAGGAPGYGGDYVQLPAGVVSNMNAITIEAWADFSSATNYPYEPLFFFGDQDPISLNGMNYIGMQAYRADGTAGALFGKGDPGYNDEQDALVSLLSTTVVGTNTVTNVNYLGNISVAMVFNPLAGYVSFYTNGVLAVNNPNAFNPLAQTLGADPLNYLGAPLYSLTDPNFDGSIDEFRIYNGALTAGQIAANNALGPNQLMGNNMNVSLSVMPSGGNLVFSWPTNSALNTLQSSPVLGPGATWTPVAIPGGAMTMSGGNFQLTLPASGTAQYFRLSQY